MPLVQLRVNQGGMHWKLWQFGSRQGKTNCSTWDPLMPFSVLAGENIQDSTNNGGLTCSRLATYSYMLALGSEGKIADGVKILDAHTLQTVIHGQPSFLACSYPFF